MRLPSRKRTVNLRSLIGNWKYFLSALVYLAVVFFWVIVSAPGNMSPDSLESFRQIYQGDYDNFHPLSYTFLIGVTTFWGEAPVGIIVFQSLLMATTIYLLMTHLMKNAGKATILICCAAVYLTPFIGNFATTVWKDVPYACFTIIGLVLLSSMFYTPLNWKNPFLLKWIGGLASFAVGSTFRHEGIISGVIYILLVLVLSRFFLGKKWATLRFKSTLTISMLSVLVLSYLFQNFIVVQSGARLAPVDNSLSSFVHDLAYANAVNPNGMPTSVSRVLESIVSGEASVAAASCVNGSLLFEKVGFNASELRENASVIPKLWLRALFSDSAPNLLKARYCKAQTFIPWPLALPPSKYVWGYFGIDPNPYGLENEIKDGRFYEETVKLRNIAISWLNTWNNVGRAIAWPGIHTTFLFVIFILFRQKLRIDPGLAIFILALVIGRTLLLITVTNGPWYRLALPIHIISVCTFAMVLSRLVHFLRIEFRKL